MEVCDVAPRAGARIETYCGRTYRESTKGRPPCGGAD